MTELPPLPKPDNGTILVGREEISLGHSDEALRAYAEEAIKQERAACIAVVMDERVDAEATQAKEDEAYNLALCHAVDSLRARSEK